jgi:hypothetical protein
MYLEDALEAKASDAELRESTLNIYIFGTKLDQNVSSGDDAHQQDR